jgi:hypothetical protein
MSLKIRRGLEADRILITPSVGEFLYTTDTKQVYIGDGITAGGNAITQSVVWGSITGTLVAQTDLISYLSTNYYPLSSNPANYATESFVTSQGYITNVITALGFTPENVANKSTNLTSPDNTKYPTTQAVVDGLATKQDTLTNPVTGTGANGQVAIWNGTNSQTGDNGLFWDNINKRLGVGTNAPGYGVSHIGSIGVASFFSQRDYGFNAFSQISQRANYIAYNTGGTSGLGIGVDPEGPTLQGFTGTIGNPSAKTLIFQHLGGNVIIGAKIAGARLDVRAQGALSTDIAFRVRNSADTANLLSVNGVGLLNVNDNLFLQNDKGLYFNSTSLGINASSGVGTLRLVTNSINRLIIDNNGNINSINSPTARFSDILITGSNIEFRNGIHFFSWENTGNVFQIKNITNSNTIPFIVFKNTNNIGISTTTDVASAVLNVNSTTKGFLPPRMTNAQRLAIASPAVGLIVYCTDATEGLYINKSTGWQFII